MRHYVGISGKNTSCSWSGRCAWCGLLLRLLDDGLLFNQLTIGSGDKLHCLLAQLLRSLLLNGNLLDSQLLPLHQHLLVGIIGVEGLLLRRLLLLLWSRSWLLLNRTQARCSGAYNNLSFSLLLLQPEHLLLLC